jgi:hypothetical protein
LTFPAVLLRISALRFAAVLFFNPAVYFFCTFDFAILAPVDTRLKYITVDRQ